MQLGLSLHATTIWQYSYQWLYISDIGCQNNYFPHRPIIPMALGCLKTFNHVNFEPSRTLYIQYDIESRGQNAIQCICFEKSCNRVTILANRVEDVLGYGRERKYIQ